MRTLLFLFSAALLFVSCRSNELIRPGDSLEVAYEKALNQFEEENYSEAASAFETVISIGRGTDIGQDAQYYLAESYFNNRRYLLAASEYERYAQFHPNSPRREEVDFKKALSYYNMSPRYRLDQTYTYQAIENFRLLLSRFPNSEYADEAGEYISELRSKLARKSYTAGEFYKRTSRYQAAAVYFDIVIDDYPETTWAERSLVDQMESYILYAENSVPDRQAERFEKALESYETYLQLFPRGDNRSRVEDLYDRAQQGLRQAEDSDSVAQSS
ncbi:outer membrane protein assembly factor BamD [Rhodohalobacter barkolensis]|uniref:Outer membrane protein assembly factor BamD n=1 Tax=Rhodohalobacter barkolensis TaxID=2053187 RepID=A0A2N0VKV7_9BACT|nr:outer membrane protein assembly factor BamD [Rhodohalobacter barkolensis]PKD44828.1 outer membrane protein assembly factor BamD [Rhodohalobacter barkolensis]